MSDLVERLRAATGPDPMLDAAIALSQGWTETEHAWIAPNYTARQDDPPRYTSSIDAALTLVPAGWSWKAGNRSHRGDNARDGYANIGLFVEVDASTPAIALCIAALMAREVAP